MAGSSKRTARRVATKDWRAKALRLHIDGHTMREIAAKVGKALSTVHEGIEAEIAAVTAPLSQEAKAMRDREREIENARLTAVMRGAMSAARRGDPDAAHIIISASRQRSKLLGLEAPTKTEVTGRDGGAISFDVSNLTDAQLDKLIAGEVVELDEANAEADSGAAQDGESEGASGEG